MIKKVRKVQSETYLILERLVWHLYRICGLLDNIKETCQGEHCTRIVFTPNLDQAQSLTLFYLNQLRSGSLKTALCRHHLKSNVCDHSERNVLNVEIDTKDPSIYNNSNQPGKEIWINLFKKMYPTAL